MLKLYNTLTKNKEMFKPIKNKKVGIYTCGPTVYGYAHIGNLRTYIFADILKKYLKYEGYKVKHVMNITDVGHLTSDGDTGEDKIKKEARLEHKSAWDIANFYTHVFFEDSEALNIEKPDIISKATDYIKDQIEFIQKLEKKGFTYVIKDGVYFDTSKLKDYGKLAKLDIKGLKAGARIKSVIGKKNITDFALWKFSPKDKKRQMEWDSPWGRGFPGWHIECSTMSMKHLGKTIDIHTGGIDHIPVHHTNEIAQSEALTGKPFVNYWMHGEFLLVKSGRMGKSEGNLIKISDLQEEGYNPLAYRLLTLQAHYRDKLDFTKRNLKAAQITLNRIYNDIRRYLSIKKETSGLNISDILDKSDQKFEQAMNDDLNTPKAFAEIFKLLNKVNKLLDLNKLSSTDGQKIFNLLLKFDHVFGLSFEKIKKEEILPVEIEILIKDRENARRVKNFKKADEIRVSLKNKGIELEDTAKDVRWKKIDKF